MSSQDELLPSKRVVFGEGDDVGSDPVPLGRPLSSRVPRGSFSSDPGAPGRGSPIDASNTLRVEVWAPSFVGGDVVSGNVYLDVLVPFYAQGVEAELVGYEEVRFQAPGHDSARGAESAVEPEGAAEPPAEAPAAAQDGVAGEALPEDEGVERVLLFKRSERLSPHDGTYSAGKYVFPFAFPLPASLPGVYHEKGGDWGVDSGFAAKIMYKLRACVKAPITDHHLKCSTRLVVNDRFDAAPQPPAAEATMSLADQSLPPPYTGSSSNVAVSASAAGALGQKPKNGDLAVKVRLDKAAYFPGERVIVRLRANSTLKRSVPRISMRVTHTLWLVAQGSKRCLTREIHSREAEGLPPFFLGLRHLYFDLSPTLPPCTAAGSLVRSSYTVDVAFDVGEKDGAAGGVLSVTMPLTVLAPHVMFATDDERAHVAAPLLTAVPADVSYRSPWQADEETVACSACKVRFKVYLRRHHCRHCGQIFCNNCTKNRSSIVRLEYMTPVRVCDACYPIAQAGGVPRTTTTHN